MIEREKKYYTVDEARQAIKQYCAIQERSHKQVLDKLGTYGLKADIAGEILIELIDQGFLNESRFADMFAQGKSRINGWGGRKIEYALRMLGVSVDYIKQALKNLDTTETDAKLEKLAAKKYKELQDERPNNRKRKTITYLLGRGFSYEKILAVLNKIETD